VTPTALSKVASWAGGRLLAGGADVLVTNICTDSRSLKAGDLFVALRGENFDAHSFVGEAAVRGAVGAIVEKAPSGLPGRFGIIEVLDTLRALQSLAGSYRATLAAKVIGITGSNGKTSTKDFTAAVLARRFSTAKTRGNLNNHIGVPLTLLALDHTHEVAVVEMGMNHPGEIAPLARLARPDAAIITNVGVAHIEFMGTRDAIASEKGELAISIGPGGTVILNADDDFSPAIANRVASSSGARVITAGISRGDVRATDLEVTSSGSKFRLHSTGQCVQAELPVPGEHMVRNALLACAAGIAFGLTLEECAAGIREPALSTGRMQQRKIAGLTILDDSYNSNPDSAVAGIATLAALPGPGRRIAVLGRMAELGRESEAGHRRVGEAAAAHRLACLITVGAEAGWIADAARARGAAHVVHVADAAAAAASVRAFAREGDIVLIKGSRSAKMEHVITDLERGGIA
jgi:UDP-N-acetylmuramoyl-tripeptide--D-alanyl-D-alanine ligase